MMRHFRNRLALTQPISVHRAASFPQHCAKDRSAGGIGRSSPGTRRAPRLFSSSGFCNRLNTPANSTCGKTAAGWFEAGLAGQTDALVLDVDEDAGIEQALRVDCALRGA